MSFLENFSSFSPLGGAFCARGSKKMRTPQGAHLLKIDLIIGLAGIDQLGVAGLSFSEFCTKNIIEAAVIQPYKLCFQIGLFDHSNITHIHPDSLATVY